MVRSRRFVLSLALLPLATTPMVAQRVVTLTGKPQASLKEPFSRVGGVRELPGNRAIILDSQDDRLVLADFTAGSVKEIGRKGSGPGEFQRPNGLLVGLADATWVPDPMLSKVHVVGADGKIAANGLIPPQADGAPIAMMPRAADRMGRLYIQGTPSVGANGAISDSVWVLRWTPTSNKIDTITKVPSGLKINATSSGGRQSITMRSKPFNADEAWVVLPDGRVALIHSSPYRVDILEGKQPRVGTPIPFTPIKVTAADRDAFRKSMKSSRPIVRTIGGGGGGSSAPSVSSPSIPDTPDAEFPATKPAFLGQAAVRVSPEGEIWVLRARAATDPLPTYDIFDGTGKLVGKATLNANSTIAGFGNGVAYIARTDPDDDLMYVERFARPRGTDSGAKPIGGN